MPTNDTGAEGGIPKKFDIEPSRFPRQSGNLDGEGWEDDFPGYVPEPGPESPARFGPDSPLHRKKGQQNA
jgi:hypothetical protein